jgi:hypothetical protein
MRRYRYIIIGVIVAIIVGLAAFLLISRNQSQIVTPGESGTLPQTGTQANANNNTVGQVGLPAGNASQAPLAAIFGVVSNEPVLNYFVDASNTVITVEPDGKIEQITNTQSIYLNSTEIPNVTFADFSYDGKRVLVGFGNPTALQWSIFDVAKKAWSPLSVNPTAAAWSPSNYQIAYLAQTSDVSSLETIDTSDPHASPKFLTSFPATDFQVLWRSPSTIFLLDKSSALFSGSIFGVDAKTGTLSRIVANRVGLESQWSNNGTLGLILAGTDLARGGHLGIIDNAGNLLHQMSFLTLPSKCAFATSAGTAPATTTLTGASSTFALFCGVPRDATKLNNNSLPDAYEERMFMTLDDLYRVNLPDGSVGAILVGASQNLDVSNVKFFNNILFFVNRYDQKLYALSLGTSTSP